MKGGKGRSGKASMPLKKRLQKAAQNQGDSDEEIDEDQRWLDSLPETQREAKLYEREEQNRDLEDIKKLKLHNQSQEEDSDSLPKKKK